MPKLDDDDFKRISDIMAKEDQTIGPRSRIPVGWVFSGAAGLVMLTIAASAFVAEVRGTMRDQLTIEYARVWSVEAETLNPGWNAPNADKIQWTIKHGYQ